MDDAAFISRLHTELVRTEPALQSLMAEVAGAVLDLPQKRGRALAGVLADLLRMFRADAHPPLDTTAWTARVRKLPKPDQAVVDRLIRQLNTHLLDAITNAAPPELRQPIEQVRIRSKALALQGRTADTRRS